jgi:hypothetical protein
MSVDPGRRENRRNALTKEEVAAQTGWWGYDTSRGHN